MHIISCFLNACSIVLFYLWIQLWWERCYEVVWMKPWKCLLGVLNVSKCLEFGVQTRAVSSTGNLDDKVEFSLAKWKVKFCFQTLQHMSQQNSGLTLARCCRPVEIQPDAKAIRSGVIPSISASGPVSSLIWPHAWWYRRLNFYLQSPCTNDVAADFWC